MLATGVSFYNLGRDVIIQIMTNHLNDINVVDYPNINFNKPRKAFIQLIISMLNLVNVILKNSKTYVIF